MESTIITINELYQIELMPSGNYYPMRRSEVDGHFYYFRKGNKQESRKTEKGARKFVAEYSERVGDTAILALASWMNGLQMQEAPAAEPVAEESEIVSTPMVAKPFIIREEAHPFKAITFFRVYYTTGEPLYMGDESLENVEKRLRAHQMVESITVHYLNGTVEAEQPQHTVFTVLDSKVEHQPFSAQVVTPSCTHTAAFLGFFDTAEEAMQAVAIQYGHDTVCLTVAAFQDVCKARGISYVEVAPPMPTKYDYPAREMNAVLLGAYADTLRPHAQARADGEQVPMSVITLLGDGMARIRVLSIHEMCDLPEGSTWHYHYYVEPHGAAPVEVQEQEELQHAEQSFFDKQSPAYSEWLNAQREPVEHAPYCNCPNCQPGDEPLTPDAAADNYYDALSDGHKLAHPEQYDGDEVGRVAQTRGVTLYTYVPRDEQIGVRVLDADDIIPRWLADGYFVSQDIAESTVTFVLKEYGKPFVYVSPDAFKAACEARIPTVQEHDTWHDEYARALAQGNKRYGTCKHLYVSGNGRCLECSEKV